jgi:hypothetical protein
VYEYRKPWTPFHHPQIHKKRIRIRQQNEEVQNQLTPYHTPRNKQNLMSGLKQKLQYRTLPLKMHSRFSGLKKDTPTSTASETATTRQRKEKFPPTVTISKTDCFNILKNLKQVITTDVSSTYIQQGRSNYELVNIIRYK